MLCKKSVILSPLYMILGDPVRIRQSMYDPAIVGKGYV